MIFEKLWSNAPETLVSITEDAEALIRTRGAFQEVKDKFAIAKADVELEIDGAAWKVIYEQKPKGRNPVFELKLVGHACETIVSRLWNSNDDQKALRSVVRYGIVHMMRQPYRGSISPLQRLLDREKARDEAIQKENDDRVYNDVR